MKPRTVCGCQPVAFMICGKRRALRSLHHSDDFGLLVGAIALRLAAAGRTLFSSEFSRRCARRFFSVCLKLGLDQRILRIAKLLLPLVAKPATVGPVPLFSLGDRPVRVDLGAVFFYSRAESLPRLAHVRQMYASHSTSDRLRIARRLLGRLARDEL